MCLSTVFPLWSNQSLLAKVELVQPKLGTRSQTWDEPDELWTVDSPFQIQPGSAEQLEGSGAGRACIGGRS
jgi:hypothetical protein